LVQVDYVAIDETKASRGDGTPDGLRLIGAVNTIDGAAEIHCARSERIARAACHVAGKIWLTFDHFRRRHPVGPFGLANNSHLAAPLKSVSTNADPVTECATPGLNEVKEALARIDYDRARRFSGSIKYDLRLKSGRQLFVLSVRHVARLFFNYFDALLTALCVR